VGEISFLSFSWTVVRKPGHGWPRALELAERGVRLLDVGSILVEIQR
jgi:hypothetical protein